MLRLDEAQKDKKRETYPDFPCVMEAEFVGPNTDHSPTIQQDNSKGNGIEHGFGSESETLLDCPECIYTNRLEGNRQLKCRLSEMLSLPVRQFQQ